MKKGLSMLLAAALCAGTLAGCGAAAEETGAGSASAFKIGGTTPLTGAAAIYGNAVKNGAQIAVDEINAEGGAIQFELKFCLLYTSHMPSSSPCRLSSRLFSSPRSNNASA